MKRTTIMADEAVLEKIGRIAYKTGKSKAHIIREALADYVVEHDSEPTEEWQANPILGLIGLADEFTNPDQPFEQLDYEAGEHKKIVQARLNDKYERILREREEDLAKDESARTG